MGDTIFSAVFGSDISNVKEVVENAMEFVNGIFPNILADTFFEVKLILSEALHNAVIHGNKEREDKNVSLTIKVYDGAAIMIQVADEGEGFSCLSASSQAEQCDSVMRENGRGIKIVRALSNEIAYNKKGNIIRICKRVGCDG